MAAARMATEAYAARRRWQLTSPTRSTRARRSGGLAIPALSIHLGLPSGASQPAGNTQREG